MFSPVVVLGRPTCRQDCDYGETRCEQKHTQEAQSLPDTGFGGGADSTYVTTRRIGHSLTRIRLIAQTTSRHRLAKAFISQDWGGAQCVHCGENFTWVGPLLGEWRGGPHTQPPGTRRSRPIWGQSMDRKCHYFLLVIDAGKLAALCDRLSLSLKMIAFLCFGYCNDTVRRVQVPVCEAVKCGRLGNGQPTSQPAICPSPSFVRPFIDCRSVAKLGGTTTPINEGT